MKMLNLFGKSVVSVAVVVACFGANAAQNGRAGMMAASTSARMPTMPVVGLTTIGNNAVTTINQPAETNLPHGNVVPTPVVPDDTKPATGCADGGVRNSEYTISMCMNDILQCVNTGALQGGLNDLFNEDVRNSIMGGMRLCQEQIDKCVREVRNDCKNVYSSSADVWMNFNCSVVQPEYYNFVLRKTGLTPNQAENTCLLLDRNTYGSSFSAVSDANAVNTEYNNKVGAYNKANSGTLSKDNPQGVAVNTVGYDGNRGHYARWDASNAECLLRVAAYNKDKLITNSWLFGAVGNDNPAEVWEKAGSTFTCTKELFDFDSLLNDTKTAAVIAVPGGAVLGTAIGAAAGAGAYNNKMEKYNAAVEEAKENMYADPCEDEEYTKKLGDYIQNQLHQDRVLATYLYEKVDLKEEDGKTLAEIDEESAKPVFKPGDNWVEMSADQCRAIHGLYSKLNEYKAALEYCNIHALKAGTQKVVLPDVIDRSSFASQYSVQCHAENSCQSQQEITVYENKCLFVPLQVGFSVKENNILCEHNGECVSADKTQLDIDTLESLLNKFKSVIAKGVLSGTDPNSIDKPNKGAEIGKGAGIGLATGTAAGGLATAITAFVEKSNITCKVGDGLNSVALGKSHSIDSLKDFYVKWNLHLPDTGAVSANASNATYASSLEQMCFNYFKPKDSDTVNVVMNESQWAAECAKYKDNLFKCPNVRIYYKNASTLVDNACKQIGDKCSINKEVFDKYYTK